MTKRVLSWVNTQRAKAGAAPLEEMPQGEQFSPEGCPLANAFHGVLALGEGEHVFAYPTGIEVIQTGTGEEWALVSRITCPLYVGEAIRRFDNGKYPDLIARG